jgi:hypothetical protein
MNRLKKFRMILAEQGIEMTLQEAKNAYKHLKSFIKKSRNMSIKDIWMLEETEVEGFSSEEKNNMIRLYQMAKEF